MNETFTDIIALEIQKKLNDKGIYMFEQKKIIRDNLDDINTSKLLKQILYPLYQKYKSEILKTRLNADIDSFCDYRNGRLNTLLLNILDGNLKTSNLVTIATTNYIEKLEARYTNRPSRFDRVVEFPLPNEESRKIFIEKTVKPEDISKIDIDKWVKNTKGYTIDHMNELILLFFVFGHSEEESFETMNKMVLNNNRLKNMSSSNKKTLGFQNTDD